MRKLIILKVPEATHLDTLPDDVQAAISTVFAAWANETLPGTQAVGGYRLIKARLTAHKSKVQKLITGFKLDWEDLGMRSCVAQIMHDADGEVITKDVVTTDPDTGEQVVTKVPDKELIFDTPLSGKILDYLIVSAAKPVQLARGAGDDEIWIK